MSEHTGLSFAEIEELRIDIFMLLLRDAFIYKQSQTEAGRDYLEKCWILEQKDPDRTALREKFGRGVL